MTTRAMVGDTAAIVWPPGNEVGVTVTHFSGLCARRPITVVERSCRTGEDVGVASSECRHAESPLHPFNAVEPDARLISQQRILGAADHHGHVYCTGVPTSHATASACGVLSVRSAPPALIGRATSLSLHPSRVRHGFYVVPRGSRAGLGGEGRDAVSLVKLLEY